MQSLSLSTPSKWVHGGVSDHTLRQQFSMGSDERAVEIASNVTANVTDAIGVDGAPNVLPPKSLSTRASFGQLRSWYGFVNDGVISASAIVYGTARNVSVA